MNCSITGQVDLREKSVPVKVYLECECLTLCLTLFCSSRVIDHGEENRMTTQSVAIVFGPTLLRPETETLNMAVHMVYQNQIVELILIEYESIFGR